MLIHMHIVYVYTHRQRYMNVCIAWMYALEPYREACGTAVRAEPLLSAKRIGVNLQGLSSYELWFVL